MVKWEYHLCEVPNEMMDLGRGNQQLPTSQKTTRYVNLVESLQVQCCLQIILAKVTNVNLFKLLKKYLGQRNMINDNIGIQLAKSRLQKTLQEKWLGSLIYSKYITKREGMGEKREREIMFQIIFITCKNIKLGKLQYKIVFKKTNLPYFLKKHTAQKHKKCTKIVTIGASPVA